MPERKPEPIAEPVQHLCMFCGSTYTTPNAATPAPSANVSGALPYTPTHVPRDVPESISEHERTGESVAEPQRAAQRLSEPFGEHVPSLLIFMW